MSGFNYERPPPFTQQELIFAYSLMSGHFTGALLNIGLLYFLIKNYQSVAKNPHLLLIFNLTFADSIFMCIGTVRYIPKLFSSSFSIGVAGCGFEGVFITMGGIGSVFALAWVALERMLTVVKEAARDIFFWKILITAGWLMTLFFSIIPLALPQGYVLQPSGVYCHYDWSTHEKKKMLYAMLIGGVFSIMIANCIMYTLVALKIKRLQASSQSNALAHSSSSTSLKLRSLKTEPKTPALATTITTTPESKYGVFNRPLDKHSYIPSSPICTSLHPSPPFKSSIESNSSPMPFPISTSGVTLCSESVTKRVRKWERVIYLKSVTLALCFIACWSPFLVSAIIRLIELKISKETDFWTSLLVVLNSVLNPILALTMDPKISKFARDTMHGWKRPYKKKQPNTASSTFHTNFVSFSDPRMATNHF